MIKPWSLLLKLRKVYKQNLACFDFSGKIASCSVSVRKMKNQHLVKITRIGQN